MKLKLCCYPGCNKLSAGYYCPTHAAKREAERRQNAFRYASRYADYSNPEWRKLSRQLIQEKGCCERCGGTIGLSVHHIIPVRYAPELFLDRSNLLVLCRECHAVETAREIRGRKR